MDNQSFHNKQGYLCVARDEEEDDDDDDGDDQRHPITHRDQRLRGPTTTGSSSNMVVSTPSSSSSPPPPSLSLVENASITNTPTRSSQMRNHDAPVELRDAKHSWQSYQRSEITWSVAAVKEKEEYDDEKKKHDTTGESLTISPLPIPTSIDLIPECLVPPHPTISTTAAVPSPSPSSSLVLATTASTSTKTMFSTESSTRNQHDSAFQQLYDSRIRILQSMLWGAGLGFCTALIILGLPEILTMAGIQSETTQQYLRWENANTADLQFVEAGITHYLQLFSRSEPLTTATTTTTTTTTTKPKNRLLADPDKPPNKDPTLVIAGKMTVEDAPCNIAQYDLKSGEWSLTERIQLSLYNTYSGGEIYSLLANHTEVTPDDNTDDASHTTTGGKGTTKTPTYRGSGELIVVGAFDTTYRNSQVTYCSVGMWDGTQLSKIGEGLCNSALSKGMKITTAALAGPYDVYVAGSFQTQVWNGDLHEFVQIFNIAHFNAIEQMWYPLNIGQITCSWCTVTVLALAWDSKRRQLHVAGKFNAIDGANVPAGLAIYDYDSGHLVAHPGGGLSMKNTTQDGVGTALQLDEESGVLYVMGSFERLTATYELCYGLAAYDIQANRWTCLSDAAHSVVPTGGGNMLLTPYGLMVAGKTAPSTTWPDDDRPYTIALLKATLQKRKSSASDDKYSSDDEQNYRDFEWSWLPGFDGHDEPLHALTNGFGSYEGTVFIAGDNMVAKWSYQPKTSSDADSEHRALAESRTSSPPQLVPVTEYLSGTSVRGAIMAISQMMPDYSEEESPPQGSSVNITIIVYCVSVGCVIGVIGAIIFNRNISTALFPFNQDSLKGFTLDTLTYSPLENTNIKEAYQRAMKTRYVQQPHLLTVIDPQEIFLQRIIGEGTFGRVWSAKWRSASVAVKEFVFAQAAVAGKSSMQQEIVEEIIGEAGMMAILRHPNVLQLFGCSLTAQAIWIVSELCSLGSLRQVLDDNERVLSQELRLSIALQVAEGMTYLHNQNPPIIHRDLKSHNIFIHETFTDAEDASTSSSKKRIGADQFEKLETHSVTVAKIGDWGSARAALSGSRTMTHGVGTACWLAPEVIKHARSSKFSDVYGYGIVLWELATREEVYQGLETTQIIAKVANENLRPPVPMDCPWKDVMVKCWAENPQDRLEFSEIVQELNALKTPQRQDVNARNLGQTL